MKNIYILYMTNWGINENNNALEYLQRPEVVVGDTIEICIILKFNRYYRSYYY